VRWTEPDQEDCFLALDATSAAAAGYMVSDADGTPIEGNVLFRDGLRIRKPGAADETIITDGWQMLALFDDNQDGRVDPSDPVWAHLYLFMDYDMDGLMKVNQELHRPPTALRSMGTAHGSPYTDPFENVRSDGTWEDDTGASRLMTGVTFAELPVPVLSATWGGIKTRAW
jgi:hypothetical protein